MISIKHLKKCFAEQTVLNDINLHIGKGKIYGLVGRSGAGKSTLLRCINGLESYDEGSLTVDSIEVSSLSAKAAREFKKDIGMIFQQFSLLSRLNVYENIALPMKCWNYNQTHIDRKVKELVEVVGIHDKIHAFPAQLSGGQKQRVAIARALAMNPRILLCDEATSALDPQTANSIISLLDTINKQMGITIVVVTHQMSVLRRSCEDISILENGKIAESGSVVEIFLRQPKALINLIGRKDQILPHTGINIKISLSQEVAQKPLITEMARNLQIDFLFMGGEMERFRDSVLGSLTINVNDEDYTGVTEFLNAHRVPWQVLLPLECAEQALAEEEY
ncbi:methionine ABC transporter ATP-binding protein [Sporomusa aerivorans]|uniref:methionine ABC transporter ATP-binding protein n=1 Tax=Sporomusa aerivorans TaxID=204936 RepID=UPI00352B287E